MSPLDFPVVGIGASAGGLDALKKFFSTIPKDSGMAFVLILHLDPNHESLMAELLARYTALKVVQAEDKMPLECDFVYVIPPNKYLSIQKGVLHMSKPSERRGLRMPIDYFFRSLAEDQQDKAICIILSGTGTDGTLGLKSVKAQGGMVMVQLPDTAQYDGMPCSAIATGMVDYNLSIEEMGETLLKYTRHPYISSKKTPALPETDSDHLNRILALLRTRHDFRHYKKNTLNRRIERRMSLSHIENMIDYVAYLKKDQTEVIRLSKDMLISVTNFFRDQGAFSELEERVIPQLLQNRPLNAPLRVWVPGCATGEEAYSIAMLLIEQLSAAQMNCELKLFATDVDEDALKFARFGLYPESIATDVPVERLRRFFIKNGQHYQVSRQLRDSVVFASQNLISDPPFSRLDLISCRNLLIYLELDVQKKLISLFHFALHEGGYLLLGASETLGQRQDLFEMVSKKWRIFHRIGPARSNTMDFPQLEAEKHTEISLLARNGVPRMPELAQRILLDEYTPASVIINRKHDIVYFYGAVSRYLDLPMGEPTHNLLSMAREGMQPKLRALVHKAIREGQTMVGKTRIESGWVKIMVKPLTRPKEGLSLISFTDEPNMATALSEMAEAEKKRRRRLSQAIGI
jgi:two-component system CheB/CheR fusion protein